jgi:hypothetical protein
VPKLGCTVLFQEPHTKLSLPNRWPWVLMRDLEWVKNRIRTYLPEPLIPSPCNKKKIPVLTCDLSFTCVRPCFRRRLSAAPALSEGWRLSQAHWPRDSYRRILRAQSDSGNLQTLSPLHCPRGLLKLGFTSQIVTPTLPPVPWINILTSSNLNYSGQESFKRRRYHHSDLSTKFNRYETISRILIHFAGQYL